MKSIDTNADGKIAFEEYVAWVQNSEWKASIFDHALKGEWHPVAEQYWGYMKAPPTCVCLSLSFVADPTLIHPPRSLSQPPSCSLSCRVE